MAITTPAPVRSHPAHPVSIRGVGRTFAPRDRSGSPTPVLADVDLDIAAGEIVALIGASGCGKSTLLRQVSGLDAPTTGRILIDGSPVDGVDTRCAVAFQEPRLLPWRTLAQNVAVGLPRGTDRAVGRQRVHELLGLVGLGECTHYRPRQISGGMAQRTSLARALARNPGVLVLDEPFGALDAQTKRAMQDFLLAVWQRTGTTILMVTHDVEEAIYLSQRIYVLTPRPGRVATVIDVPFGRDRGPTVKRDPRFLDLRDEIEHLLSTQHAPAPTGA